MGPKRSLRIPQIPNALPPQLSQLLRRPSQQTRPHLDPQILREPTATATPEPTATPTPEPTATPTPEPTLVPNTDVDTNGHSGANTNPYTSRRPYSSAPGYAHAGVEPVSDAERNAVAGPNIRRDR